jgi:hypothetical protein
MPIDISIITEHLQQMQLFHDLSGEDLSTIGSRLRDYVLPRGEILFSEGDVGENFYLIYRGEVSVWVQEGENIRELATLETGDYFGEEALLLQRPRSASITATTDTILLFLDKENFDWLLSTYSNVKYNLATTAATHEQARKLKFQWLNEGEVIYLITRRHPMSIFFDMFKPGLLLLVACFLFLFSFIAPTPSTQLLPIVIGSILVLLSIIWGIWESIDWRNDYFIITNQRAVWLEKVILQSASRQEAPLSAIQSVNILTSQLGRILNYGNVIIRTYTGQLVMTFVDQPDSMKVLIHELMLRSRKKTQTAEESSMRQAIRIGLGLTEGEVDPVRIGVIPHEDEHANHRGSRIFSTRSVKDGIITYHKHWYVLFLKTWMPMLFIFGVIFVMIFLIWRDFASSEAVYPPMTSSLLLGFLFLLPPTAVLVYQYLDWKNDIYRLTKDSIVDSEKKPLGTEVTKSAPLKNVLSLEHQKEGILNILLNFGTVNINVGDATLSFFDVHDPALVQQDIFYRMEAMKRKAEETHSSRERDRMVEWIKAYHDVFTEEQNSSEELSETEI